MLQSINNSKTEKLCSKFVKPLYESHLWYIFGICYLWYILKGKWGEMCFPKYNSFKIQPKEGSLNILTIK